MADSRNDGFLSRWSRRKRDGNTDPEPAETHDPVAEPDDAGPPKGDPDGAGDEGDPEVVASLPDIDSMDDSSDFKVFLQAGVPEALRRQALRKLWRINPVLANLDGLNDYDGDYSKLHVAGRAVKTLYQIGKGFVTEDAEAEDEPLEPPADAMAESPPETAELPATPTLQTQTSTLDTPLSRAAPPVSEPVEMTRRSKGGARDRRWGTPDKSS